MSDCVKLTHLSPNASCDKIPCCLLQQGDNSDRHCQNAVRVLRSHILRHGFKQHLLPPSFEERAHVVPALSHLRFILIEELAVVEREDCVTHKLTALTVTATAYTDY